MKTVTLKVKHVIDRMNARLMITSCDSDENTCLILIGGNRGNALGITFAMLIVGQDEQVIAMPKELLVSSRILCVDTFDLDYGPYEGSDKIEIKSIRV